MIARLSRLARTASFLIHQRTTGFDVSGEPLLDAEAKTWFIEHLEQSRSYLEYGAGGTTLLAARQGVPTLSVESDRFFARAVKAKLPSNSSATVIDPRIGLTTEWGIPFPGSPNPQRVARWRRYVELPFEVISQADRALPDLVLVDGRFRRACALKVASEACRAGQECALLFDDYFSEGRTHYAQVEDHLGTPTPIGRAAVFMSVGKRDVPPNIIETALADYR